MKDLRLKIFAALPFFMIAAAYFGAVRLNPDWAVLTPAEQTLLDFTPEDAVIPQVKRERASQNTLLKDIDIFGSLRSAMKYNTGDDLSTNGAPAGEGKADKAPGGLTLAISNGGRSMAILNGMAVREGERVGAMTVKRIERDKVLVFDKNLRWIHMEGKR